MSYDFEKIYINGQWVDSDSGEFIEVENPATLEHFARVPDGNANDIDRAAQAAHAALAAWSAVPLQERIVLMKKMLKLFESYQDQIVELEVKELGSPVEFATESHCLYQYTRTRSYIEAAESLVLEKSLPLSQVYREPIGVVGCITPWNYPLGQVVQKVIPAILMGNTVILKPSQHTPLTCYLLVDAFDKAGFPAGVINLVTGRGSKVGDAIASHPLVNMVSFTGSTRVGIQLSQRALESLKHISLELGGKSPFIWLPMKDYAPAVSKLFSSIFLNSGQTCTAFSRLLVPEQDLEKVKATLLAHVGEYTVGDPTDSRNKLGPLSSKAQFEKVASYIRLGLEEGATLLSGEIPTDCSKGYYVKPTIFTNVKNSMRIAREEIFGPVLCVITYKDVEEAIAIANDTPYGLNAAVYGPKDEAMAVARRIQAGNVYINDAPRDVLAPFGGYKQSGIGREGGVAGLLEFTQLKAIFNHSSY
ncbi:MAG TPA: aldehyde dehydrogenase family protein [Candidatus Aphodousia gallistercoris]|nr:aldehyde dehydrogenase family protein [Candidatus Aphodousia gallistercoris]